MEKKDLQYFAEDNSLCDTRKVLLLTERKNCVSCCATAVFQRGILNWDLVLMTVIHAQPCNKMFFFSTSVYTDWVLIPAIHVQLSLGVRGRLIPGFLPTPKSAGAPVTYVKWSSLSCLQLVQSLLDSVKHPWVVYSIKYNVNALHIAVVFRGLQGKRLVHAQERCVF